MAKHSEAALSAFDIQNQLPEATINFVIDTDDSRQVPPEIAKIFFELQTACEKKGSMNYREYARDLWTQAFGVLEPAQGPVYDQFETNLIRGMHSINMHDLVYDDVDEPEKLKKFGKIFKEAKSVILWSTGDVAATGYQDAKIASSRVAHDFMKSLAEKTASGATRLPKEIKEKTHYLVRDNKFLALQDYLSTKKPPLKIVIVEDSRKNIDKINELVKTLFGENGTVTVIPAWATYSREGQTERKKSEDGFDKARHDYNGIDSLSELAAPEWSERLNNAEILVDFDGIIGDNIRMRNAQAQVKWQSLQRAAEEIGIPSDQLFKKHE